MIDYHIHTYLCNHANGTVEQYVEFALQSGLKEMGFSDHGPMPSWYDPDSRMHLHQFELYHEMVHRVKKAYQADIDIKFGIELDFAHGTEEFVASFLRDHEFDYVLGSVHYLEDWNFDHPKFIGRYDVVGVDYTYEVYYQLLKEAVATGLFDIVAHFDLPKKFGHKPSRQFDVQIDDILTDIKKSKMCIEINTSGLRRPVNEIYPAPTIIKRMQAAQIPIVLGSDSHEPNQIGFAFHSVIPILQEIGYTGTMKFKNRKPKFQKFAGDGGV